MEMTQVHTLVNNATKEAIGDTEVLAEDLSNVVDIGTAVFNANAFDHYVRSLVNHIGKVIFVNRTYRGIAPNILMDGWEYGSVLEKIHSEMPEAVENASWELTDGTSYDPNVFHKPVATAKFFNKRVTFELDRSVTERQVKESFSSATQLNAFISMLMNETEKSLTVKRDSLIFRTIANFIGETVNDNKPTRYVKLLSLYNSAYSKTLTATAAIHDPDFIRYAVYIMGMYADRLSGLSKLFNIGGTTKFTSKDRLKCIYLSEFYRAAGVFLYDAASQFRTDNLSFPSGEIVPYWQGSGTGYSFSSTSSINVTLASDGETAVSKANIIAVMFDRDALGVTNYQPRVTTQWNPKAEFTNYFYKMDAGYFNDLNENFVVFTLE